MYRRILVTLDHSAADEAILKHVENLHQYIQSEVVLLHVADGWAARYKDQLNLKDSEEVQEDQTYLEEVQKKLEGKGIAVQSFLAMGDPAEEIIRFIEKHDCDLLAMAMHGHRFLADLILGSTVTKVRHRVHIPVLLVRA